MSFAGNVDSSQETNSVKSISRSLEVFIFNSLLCSIETWDFEKEKKKRAEADTIAWCNHARHIYESRNYVIKFWSIGRKPIWVSVRSLELYIPYLNGVNLKFQERWKADCTLCAQLSKGFDNAPLVARGKFGSRQIRNINCQIKY